MPMPPAENRDHDTKSLLLVEFFESVVVYAVYLAVRYMLPNTKYYLAMRKLLQHPDKRHAALTSILKRKFRLSGIHQLAFLFKN